MTTTEARDELINEVGWYIAKLNDRETRWARGSWAVALDFDGSCWLHFGPGIPVRRGKQITTIPLPDVESGEFGDGDDIDDDGMREYAERIVDEIDDETIQRWVAAAAEVVA